MTSILPTGHGEFEMKSADNVELTLQNSSKVVVSDGKTPLVPKLEQDLENTKSFAEMITNICLEIFDKNEKKELN
jgi:hypothetical protein